MKIISFPLGSYNANGYLLTDDQNTEAAFVDCGIFEPYIKTVFNQNGIKKLKYILLTHGHFDHICGVFDLKANYGGAVCIHREDAECLEDERKSLNKMAAYAEQTPLKADCILEEGSVLFLGKETLTVWHTPGHTKGSVCFLADHILISGDTLFCGSIGRTDFPGGSRKEIKQSLRRLCTLPGDTVVYPGHNETTSIENEIRSNPYLIKL